MDGPGAGGEGKLRGKLSAQTKPYLDAGVSELVAHVQLEDVVVVVPFVRINLSRGQIRSG